jgi:hypothetical protein
MSQNDESKEPIITNEEINDGPDVEEIEKSEEEAVLIEEIVDDELLIDDSDAKEEIKDEVKEQKNKQQYVKVELPTSSSGVSKTNIELMLPSNFDKETIKKINQSPNIDLTDSKSSKEWAETIREGLDYTTYNNCYVDTLEKEDAEFSNRSVHNGSNLNAQIPRLKQTENSILKGERSVVRMMTHLGLGSIFQVPLWHSGIWVTFKPPGDSEIIELNRILTSDKINFGRNTYGLAFSNSVSYSVNRILEFAISHIYDLSTKPDEININNIKDHVLCQDIPSLLWGFACTMYPNGFNYKRGCIAAPDKCNFILQEILNITKLQFTNLRSLTEWQKTHMSNRQPKVKDLASINRYKEELNTIQNNVIIINKDSDSSTKITLQSPTINQYIESGYKWISDIVIMVDKVMGINPNDGDRNSLITEYGQASAMRNYCHWVKSIELDTNIIDDKESIELNFNVMGSDDSIREQFNEEVIKYINNSTISVIGIPVYDCPGCGSVQSKEDENSIYTNIIPLDVIQLFFGLLTQKMSNITQR